MNGQQREVITREMMRGFDACAQEAGTKITGGQTVMNPWPMIGGVANVMVLKNEYVRPNNGQPGDLILLTKPLGTQPAVNMMQRLAKDRSWCPPELSHAQIENAYYLAMESMATLNKDTSKLLHRYKSHGATDVTGFGILGHA
jgi:selenide, water dikinase